MLSMETVRRWASPRTVAAMGAFAALLLVACVAVAVRSNDRVLVASSFEVPSQPFLEAIAAAEPPALPAPSPSATTPPAQARATPSKSGGQQPRQQQPQRRTGPGGIYIPPPSQWFK
jgi:hypothetical protein